MHKYTVPYEEFADSVEHYMNLIEGTEDTVLITGFVGDDGNTKDFVLMPVGLYEKLTQNQ